VVGIDNVECGRMAARELVRRGYKRRRLSWRAGNGNLDPGPVSRFHGRAGAAPGHFGDVSYAQAYSFKAGREEMLARF
jgi:DNA-binding LacI/PurR family transcriptional regulator